MEKRESERQKEWKEYESLTENKITNLTHDLGDMKTKAKCLENELKRKDGELKMKLQALRKVRAENETLSRDLKESQQLQCNLSELMTKRDKEVRELNSEMKTLREESCQLEKKLR